MAIEIGLKSRRNFGFSALALASMLAVSACADTPDSEADALEGADAQGTNQAEDFEVAAAVDPGSDPGANKPGQVATIGDSWMANTLFTGNAISGALRRAGHPYQNYAVQGVMLLKNNLFGQSVINQAIRAVQQRHPKTIVMTGGGNDIIENATLSRDCGKSPIGNTCKAKLTEIRNAMTKLWRDMGANGVEDVVYIAYSSAAGSAPGAALESAKNLEQDCAGAEETLGIKCHFVPTEDIVKKGNLILDGIHPNQATNNRIAQRVYQVMTEGQTYR